MPPAQKKRKTRDRRIEEITFDPGARQEYLTGFHKRKQLRIQNAREAATKRETEERVRARKQIRERRKEDLERHVAEVEAELRRQNPDIPDKPTDGIDDNEAWDGFEEGGSVGEIGIASDEEYVDEDKYTTVTVEALDQPEEEDDIALVESSKDVTASNKSSKDVKQLPGSKNRIGNGKSKPKKRKFRYESRGERQASRQKQKAKNHAAKVRRTGK